MILVVKSKDEYRQEAIIFKFTGENDVFFIMGELHYQDKKTKWTCLIPSIH